MSLQNDEIKSLKLKLQSAFQRNLRTKKLENYFLSLERTINEDLSFINKECNFILQQMENIKHEISQATNQISLIKICGHSEKSKIENHLLSIDAHKKGFDVLFANERKVFDLQNKELEEKRAADEEMERQKMAKVLKTNEQKGKEAAAIEIQCDDIERECNVLRKRNRAVMLKLKRQLADAQVTRLELLKSKGFGMTCE